MDVTKHGGSAAGSLETEQRNMSEHDFLRWNGSPAIGRGGSSPRKIL
jgi:hypothetical protein